MSKRSEKIVRIMTDMMSMRFSPQSIPNCRNTNQREFLNRIKSMIPWKSRNEQPLGQSISIDQEQQTMDYIDNENKERQRNQLQYLQKLTMEHILIGNQYQLDLINISNVNRGFVDTQYIWSMKLAVPIDLLAIDFKKFIIAVGNKKQKFIELYRYSNKNINDRPTKFFVLQITKDQPKSICFFKDSLAVITSKALFIYNITNNDQVIFKCKDIYKLPQNCNLQFYKAPQPFQTILNIFLQQNIPHKSIFSLWVIEVGYCGNNIKSLPAQKIYDIKKTLKKKIILKNYCEETFIMNLGSELLVFKKGYMIDSVSIHVKNQHSRLKYKGDDRLIHVSDKKFQIYEFYLNTKRKPYKIKVAPLDAIQYKKPMEYQYFNLIEVFNGCFMVVFQIKPQCNNRTKGQLDYLFALTQPISLQSKINLIFAQKRMQQFTDDDLIDKCDTFHKMGLDTKQIYLQLWNRSEKVSENDFKLLISTRSYETIQSEIVKKLRKSSMNFLKIHKNQRDSLDMLQQNIFGARCTLQLMYDYICSHFWLKKLQNWRDLTLFQRHLSQQNISGLNLEVQSYYQLKQLNLYSTFLSLINQFCNQGKNVLHKIRFIFCNFRFPLRLIYRQLLKNIIKNIGCNIKKLLQNMPQILPYVHEQKKQLPIYAPHGYFDGIWPQITQTQWKQNLSYQRITTIDNVSVCDALKKNLNFRRNLYQNHVLIMETDKSIIQNFKYIKSDKTFYSAIQWIFQSINQKQQLKEIFSYIENTYPLMPTHLKGRIILYNQIYIFLQKNKILPQSQGRAYTFHKFLQFQDQYLFRHLFQKQKIVKGLILKKIKPMYQQISSMGVHYFNQNLLNYFRCSLSQLSDLKYIFNRINNQKKEFHIRNQEMYQVLVLTMGHKLMVGTQKDIPINQILIYVENIPIEKGKQILNRLKLINNIHNNVQLLRQSKINMSVQQIINDPQATMSKVIDYLIVKQKLKGQYNEQAFMRKSYFILATIEYLHNQIYKEKAQQSFFILFLYLAKISVDSNAIRLVKMLLQDENIIKEFKFDQGLAQSLVLYMYLLKLYEDPVYINSLKYLRQLMTLLPQQNQIRQFIICQFQFAKLLTRKPVLVQYPLSQYHPSPGLIQLQYLLNCLPIQYVIQLPAQQIFHLMQKMIRLNSRIYQGQNVILKQKQTFVSSIFHNVPSKYVSKRQVYQQFIIRILNANKIRQSIPYIQIFLNQQASNKEYDIVFPYYFVIKLENDINQHDKFLIKKIAAFYFRKPIAFFLIIKDYIMKPLNRRQRTDLLQQALTKGLSYSKGFNIQNKLLSQSLIKIAQRQGLQNRLFTVFQNCFKHLSNQKSDFMRLNFSFIYMMVINSPYCICKYMITSKRIGTFKNIRIFLTFAAKADIFDKNAILQYGRRIFLIILYALCDKSTIQEVIQKFQQYPLDMDLPLTFKPNFDTNNSFLNKLWQSSQAFRKQKAKFQQIQNRLQRKKTFSQRYKQQLLNPSILARQGPYQYEQLLPDDDIGLDDSKYIQKKVSKKKNLNQLQASSVVKNLTNKLANKEDKNFQAIIRINSNSSETTKKQEVLRTQSRQFLIQQQVKINIKPEQQVKININQQEPNQNINIPIKEIIKKSALSAADQKTNKEMKQRQLQQMLQQQDLHIVRHQSNKSNKKQIYGFYEDECQQKNYNYSDAKKDSPEGYKKYREQQSNHSRSNIGIDSFDKGSRQQNFPPNVTSGKRYKTQKQSLRSSPDSFVRGLKQSNSRLSSGKISPNQSCASNKAEASVSKQELLNQMNRIMLKVVQYILPKQDMYPHFQNFPRVPQLGLKLYRTNLIQLQKTKKKKFNIQDLKIHQDKPNFAKKYLRQIIRYLYHQAIDTPLAHIIQMIQYLVSTYPTVNINKKNLHVFIRVSNLYQKYNLQIPIRSLFPIEATFDKSGQKQQLFKCLQTNIMRNLDQVNVFKIGKVVSLAFQISNIENQIIFAFFLKEVSTDTQLMQQSDKKKLYQKLSVLISTLSNQILSQRYIQGYHRFNDQNLKKKITKEIIDKIKKKGSSQQKIKLFSSLQSYEPQCQKSLRTLKRR